MCEKVPAFQGLVDKEHQSLPARSEKMFTLYALYDATKELLADKANTADGGFMSGRWSRGLLGHSVQIHARLAQGKKP